MSYRLLVLDIDGTLRPRGEARTTRENADAVKAVQAMGVKVAIATGRGRGNIQKGLLRGIRPDYWICAAGAQVLDGADCELSAVRLGAEQMYALVDFFEDYDYPLRFIFADGSYAYLGYDYFAQREKTNPLGNPVKDGEDQDRHLLDMPFTAFGVLPPDAACRFTEKYAHLGLQFVYEGGESCDILPPGVGKETGLAAVCRAMEITPGDCVAVGDSDNDAKLLAAVGLGVAMEDASPAALQAAKRRCASVAKLCETVFLQGK